MQVLNEIHCAEDLEEAVKNNRYQWLFLDLDIFTYNYQSILKRIVKTCANHCRVVLFTNHYSVLLKQKIEQLPVAGLFGKGVSVKDLLFGLKCIAQGDRIFSAASALNGSCFSSPEKPSQKRAGLLALSKREREILNLICKGFSTMEISEKLFISKFTVETHRKNILRKLDLRSSTELVSHAYREGWVY